MKSLAALLVPLLLLGCDRGSAPAPAAQKESEAPRKVLDYDADNLLNIASGASVVSRSAEFDLDHSALHAIDGMSTTRWLPPPGDANQSMVFALPAPARIDRVGVTTGLSDGEVPANVRFEVSRDGLSWRELTSFAPKRQAGPLLVDVPPTDALYVRFTTREPKKQDIGIRSVHALGTETDVPQSQFFNGCWSINGSPAAFVQNGARIQGVVGSDKPMALDGGTDSRVARFMWLQGTMWGYAALTMAPDGRTLSMLVFHKEPFVGNAGAGWFGDRCNGAPADITPARPLEFLARVGHWSMFGLAFDATDRLIEDSSRSTLDAAADIIRNNPSQKIRIVAHEFRESTPEGNRAKTAARIAAVRAALQQRRVDVAKIELVAAGSESDVLESVFAVQRLLGSRIDLEISR